MTAPDPASSSGEAGLSKQERTYELLRERIVAGTYHPGHRLVIDTIARELGISPMPVREAIRRLEAEGWVAYHRNQGAQVAGVDPAVWQDTMQVLAVLDGYATALTAHLLDADAFAGLRAINADMRAAIEVFDVYRVAQANRRFHQAIYDRCPNEQLRRELARVQERVDSYRTVIFAQIAERPLDSVEEHETLMTMMERSGDPAEIEAYARQHKLRTVQSYLRQEAEHRAAATESRHLADEIAP